LPVDFNSAELAQRTADQAAAAVAISEATTAAAAAAAAAESTSAAATIEECNQVDVITSATTVVCFFIF
jgi:hypothetical protein